MDYFMPARLHTGNDCVASHADELAALGSSCLVVTGGAAATASGALEEVERVLTSHGITSVVWEGVTENPPISSCIEAGQLGAQNNVQFVLGVGGGSSLDAAKAIAVFAANPTLDEAGFYGMAWEHDPLPIVCVGTTAGTGSEVTKVAVLTDERHRKHSIHDDRIYATLSFGDPRYTYSCPPAVTLSCGVDVIAHATESYFSRKADEITRAFSVRAIRLALGPLAEASGGARLSPGQRAQLYDASILGGLAINTTGTCFPHNVGYYLTENYHLAHGFASAVFEPAMLRLARAYDPAYAEAFYSEIGTDEQAFIGAIEACLPNTGIRMTEAEVDEALPRWKGNGSVANTRADVGLPEIRAALVELFVR